MSRPSAAGRKPFMAPEGMRCNLPEGMTFDSAAGRKPFWAPEGMR